LQREKQLAQELKVGVFGLGKLGRSVLYQIQDQRWIKEVHAYSSLETFPHVIESKYGRDFLKELREQYSQEGQDSDSWKHGMVKALNEMPDFGKTTFHKRLETLVEDDLDVLVITAGEHLEDLTQYPERKQLLQGSLKKIKPLFSALAKKYEKNQEKIPLLVIESNPPEDLLSIGKYEYCYPPHKMTSLGADSCRYKTALLDQLRGVIQGDKIVEVSIKPEELIEYREFIGGLNLEDVELDVVGEHGNAFPLLSHCRLRGKKLEEIEPSFSKPELAYILRKDQAETGKKAMIAAGVFESDYKKTPAKVGEGLSDLAHFQERPRSSWICHLDEENAFLMWPTRIDFSNLSVHTNSDINVKNLDPEIREEIENQINIQNRIS